MSQKTELPSLTGHRTKTRKRDEKKIFDPTGFRDFLVLELDKLIDPDTGVVNLEQLFKFLDATGNKSEYDYKRYGESLMEILIAGGILAPGGSIAKDGDKVVSTPVCVFQDAVDLERARAWDQVFIKLIRRYKYLEKMLGELMKKILVYLKGFTEEERTRLAYLTALWAANGLLVPNILPIVINEHQVKDSVALHFILDILSTVKADKGSPAVLNLLKKSTLDNQLDQLFPVNKRTSENIKNSLINAQLEDVVTFMASQENAGAKKDMQRTLRNSFSSERPIKEIIAELQRSSEKNGFQESEAVTMTWVALMSSVEWNKKEDLILEQALKHLKQYIPLFSAFTTAAKSEMALLNKIQEFCYATRIFSSVSTRLYCCFTRQKCCLKK